jgi:hypothetical protein
MNDSIQIKQELLKNIYAYKITQAIACGLRLGILDTYKNESSHENVALNLNLHPHTVLRLSRLLIYAGVLEEFQPEHFKLTKAGEILINHEDGLRAIAQLHGSSTNWENWLDIDLAVQTGETPIISRTGKTIFEHYACNADDGNLFQDAMEDLCNIDKHAMLESFDFSYFKKVIDVGGGNGGIILSILSKVLQMEGTIFDLPHVKNKAEKNIQKFNLENRCSFISGDFFDNIPSGYDLYILRHILHDWNDSQAQLILNNCAQAMDENATLLVIGSIIEPTSKNQPITAFRDMNMLIMQSNGCERTLEKLLDMFHKANLTSSKVIPLPSELSVIELRKA